LKNIDEISVHISFHIDKKASDNENEKVINEILPIFTQIFEYESS
jgi:hypothetical protein